MPSRKSPRKGSLQFWPRKRASKFLPRVNWSAINSEKPIKGFICYKAGMASISVKDMTPDSMTKNKEIIIPATILECPTMKIFSIRFYKGKKVINEVLSKNLDKELKRKIKIPKSYSKKIEDIKDFDDIRIICYSMVKNTGIKKTPDIAEIGLNGNIEDKIKFAKENLEKEIFIENVFEKGQLIDLQGLTTGRGFQGPVKRFGIHLKASKSEKGRRRPGSIGPWHPARVTFRAPMAGQLGMFTRTVYNSKIVDMGKSEKKYFLKNIKNYGNVKTSYILITGSVQGPSKRQIIATFPLRETKKTKKRNYELMKVLK
jgi:large subunit ribosomal protein L3